MAVAGRDAQLPWGGLLLLEQQDGSRLPDRWRARSRSVTAVPLLPDEARQILVSGRASPTVAEDEDRLLRLVARGATTAEIAREMRVSLRTVQRRVAKLRRRFGTGSARELSALLVKSGW